MKGDKEKIKQVFINLLNNAFDAIEENGSICVNTGLGLSVTFGIIKEHNGTIKVFSPPLSGKGEEQGTQFIVVLPSGLNTKKGELNGNHSRTG